MKELALGSPKSIKILHNQHPCTIYMSAAAANQHAAAVLCLEPIPSERKNLQAGSANIITGEFFPVGAVRVYIYRYCFIQLSPADAVRRQREPSSFAIPPCYLACFGFSSVCNNISRLCSGFAGRHSLGGQAARTRGHELNDHPAEPSHSR
jgi:hypothetical protein